LFANPPPPLLASDDQTASDHLPVVMYFNNPYNLPFGILALGITNQDLTLVWESSPGRTYRVEASADLTGWFILASNVTATGTNCSFGTNVGEALSFYRVVRAP
jgi:hypothetical protein